MTLNALAQELLTAQNESLDDADAVLVTEQWIRDALDELALETDWRAFQTNGSINTVNAQRVYTLPINSRDVKYIRDINNRTQIIYKQKSQLVDLSLDLTKPGRPDFWYFESEAVAAPNVQYTIGFQPVPNAVYNLDAHFNIVPANLVSADTIPILDDMILPLKFLVRAYMSFDDNNTDISDRFYQRFLSAIDKLLRRENSKAADMGRLQQRDIPSRGRDRREARLDPDHFG